MSETDKHRKDVEQFCTGNGVDLGCSDTAIVPHAIRVDLPEDKFKNYNAQRSSHGIHWRGDATNLPFKDCTLDFVHSSHLLEDFAANDWPRVLGEWSRVLRPGGHMIIAVPDKKRFRYRVEHMNQGENCAHLKESHVGELSSYLRPMGYEILFDRFVTSTDPTEYSIICCARKR